MKYVVTIKRPETGTIVRFEYDCDPMFGIEFAILMVTDYRGWELQDVLEVS